MIGGKDYGKLKSAEINFSYGVSKAFNKWIAFFHNKN